MGGNYTKLINNNINYIFNNNYNFYYKINKKLHPWINPENKLVIKNITQPDEY